MEALLNLERVAPGGGREWLIFGETGGLSMTIVALPPPLNPLAIAATATRLKMSTYRKYCDRYGFIMRFSESN